MRTGDPARSAGGGDVGPQLAQGGGDDARLGPALHERRERDRQVHPEVVGDVGAALDLGELVGAVEHPLDVTGDELPRQAVGGVVPVVGRSEEHTSELKSLMRISSAVFCLKKKTNKPK